MSTRIAITALCIVTGVMTLGSVVLIAIPRATALPDTYGFHGSVVFFVVAFAFVGSAIAWREPRNTVGWIFLFSATVGGIGQLAGEYAAFALVERQGTLPGGDWAAWLAAWSLPFFVGSISTYLFLVFPTGRPPSRRWRPVANYTLFALVAWALSAALLPGPFNQSRYASNPLWETRAPLGPAGLMLSSVVSSVLVLPPVLLCAAGLISRFRHARGEERQQLKWMAYAAAIVAAGVALLPLTSNNKPLQVIQEATVLLIPAAAGIAILRHRLYDIDVLINRTLVYGATTTAIGGTFFVGIVVVQPLIRPLTGGSELVVAVSTLICFALFQPVRRRIQSAVDRRFYRSRYDAARTLDEFSDRLRDEVALDAVRTDLLDAVRDTVQPAHASLWLRTE